MLSTLLSRAVAFGSLLSAPVLAASFGAGIENSQWYLTESVFECALVHQVPGYGRAIFRHRAGENLSFSLEADTPLMRPGNGLLVAEAPGWRPGIAPRPLGLVAVSGNKRSVILDDRQSMQVAYGLLEGLAPTITRQSWFSAQLVRVQVSNINFASPFQGYRACAGNLLPANFDQLQDSSILFASASMALSAADKRQLDKVVAYMFADASITAVLIDGHTDKAGSRIENRKLAEHRASAVASYLKAQGIADSKIIERAHGDQFPVSENPAQNRRVAIRFQREAGGNEWQQADAMSGSRAG